MNKFQKSMLQGICASTLLIASSVSSMADSLIYIPMGSENNILIVENDGGEIVGKIDNLASVHGLAGTPDGKFLVAASFEEREMGEEAPAKPEGVSDVDHAVHHPGQSGTSAPKVDMGDMISTVSIISTADNKVIRQLDVPGSVHHVAISSDGNYAVVTHTMAGTVSIIDLNTYQLSANFATGDMPNYAVFSPNGEKLYVSNAGNNTVSVVDTNNWIVERNIIVGESPEHIVLSKDGKSLFVNNAGSASTSFISLPEATVSRTINVGDNPHGLALLEDGKTLFVAVRDADLLVAINVETGEKVQKTLAPSPYHLTNIIGTNELYISSADDPKVWVVDKETLEPIDEIEVGARAHQIVQIKN